jgi:transposase
MRPTMRFVPVKSERQSDLQSLHRARERLIAERMALINHLRAVLRQCCWSVASSSRRGAASWRRNSLTSLPTRHRA